MNRESIFIEVEELLTKMNNANLRIFDTTILFFRNETNPETAYEKYLQAHIPGAAFFDHNNFSDPSNKYEYTILSGPEIVKQIGHIGISHDSEVILYASGVLPSATRAWWILRYAGHNNVRILNGGLAAWVKAGGSLEQEVRQYKSSNFKGSIKSDMFANKEEVMKAMENSSIRMEHTLPLDMYEGVTIPGSFFFSVMDLMEEMNTFVPNEKFLPELKTETEYERIITYCGGGIAATVNAIAHLIAGHKNVAVYDGSLFEWMGEGLPITKKEI
jgi:thiosulfate/3-mercaptopyruvate sulfurtransferase